MNTEAEDKRRKILIRHIDKVRNNCNILGEKLIEKKEFQLGHNLIANGYCHDNSKFYGAEWLYLNDEANEKEPVLFKAACLHHITTNKHHPEAWEAGIHEMDRLHKAEMVCDWAARSSEFGTDLRGWIKNVATKKFNMTVQSKSYKEIKELVDLLLDDPFK
tara:strand:- start:249 stop:731 length:483 start_codon:yes stop_codon:yes gene_type:complete